MKAKFSYVEMSLLCGALLSGPGASAASADKKADLLIENAQVYTVDAARTWAQAVAVKEGKIVYVGRDEGAQAFKGKT